MKKSRTLLPQDAPLERRFVSDAELETITGIGRRTWQKHRLFGRGPRWYRLHGSVRYDLSEVIDWIRSNARGGADAASEPMSGASDAA